VSGKIRYPRKHSTCPHDCPSTCALEVEIINQKTIGRIYGASNNSYTAGVICAKVARYAERVHHPDRLATPMRRIGNKGVGIRAFEPIGWDDALDEIAEQFTLTQQRNGRQSLWPYHYAGTMGLIQRDSLDLFRNLLGTSRIHTTFCTTLVDAGWLAGTGIKRGADPRDIEHSELIVIWGGNPVNTQVNVMHHISKARRNQNAKLVVVDPYRTATAEKADFHLMLRPGSDGALACAMMHVLCKEGLVDQAYIDEFTSDLIALRMNLESQTPEWAAEITGLCADEIIAFARLYGRTQKSFIRIGYGFSRSLNGAVNVHAVTCLPALTGAWRYRGGGALYSNGDIYGIDQSIIKGLDVLDPETRVLDQSRIGEILTGNVNDLQNGPPISALMIQNTNPIAVAPDTRKVMAGFNRHNLFTCVHEQFMTETAAMADVVLPATMFLEHDDFYQAGGHTHLQVARKLIEPYGECRSNHQVLAAIADRMGFQHEGFEKSERELIDQSLSMSGYECEETLYEKHWHDCADEFETQNFLNGFETDNRKFKFKPDWSALGVYAGGLPELPDYYPVANPADDEHPYRLVTAPARQFLNTSFTETKTSLKNEKRPVILMHPKDLNKLHLKNGDPVEVGNAQASIFLICQAFDGVQQSVVIIESLWPNSAFKNGLGVNALVTALPGKPNGGALFHDIAVWIKPDIKGEQQE
jgi:anaerobic selenocysteine-containing dehydrogenase